MDPKHDEEPDYPQGAASPNFCLGLPPGRPGLSFSVLRDDFDPDVLK